MFACTGNLKPMPHHATGPSDSGRHGGTQVLCSYLRVSRPRHEYARLLISIKVHQGVGGLYQGFDIKIVPTVQGK